MSAKLLKHSKIMLKAFTKHSCIPLTPLSKNTMQTLSHIYDQLVSTHNTIFASKEYHYKITNIHKPSQIATPASSSGESHFFPSEIKQHIRKNIKYTIEYNFPVLSLPTSSIASQFTQNVRVIFAIEEETDNPHDNLSKYNKYVDQIHLWIAFLHQYVEKSCATSLTLYIYLTSLKKTVPDHGSIVLSAMHVNTAYTIPCHSPSEIVIYREEEWFKVLMHESFHNFGLDFAQISTGECTRRILSNFPIKSEVNLFEAYTEFWAELLHTILCSFYLTHKASSSISFNHVNKNKDNNNERFLNTFNDLIHYEINFSIFQMVKALSHMELNYVALHSDKPYAHALRANLYKEDTNVFAYYIAKTILLAHFQPFLGWCRTHNSNLLQFSKNPDMQQELCVFIEKYYRNAKWLHAVHCVERLWKMVTDAHDSTNRPTKELVLLKNTMRMTAVEYQL